MAGPESDSELGSDRPHKCKLCGAISRVRPGAEFDELSPEPRSALSLRSLRRRPGSASLLGQLVGEHVRVGLAFGDPGGDLGQLAPFALEAVETGAQQPVA